MNSMLTTTYPQFPHFSQNAETLDFWRFLGKFVVPFFKIVCYNFTCFKEKEQVIIMGRLTLYNDSNADTTLISNRFIDEYMKDSNDAQLKVYLYLLRMLGANLATSISDIADQFNHTEKDVIRALKYWERLKLLQLDYDEQDNITGIHIQDLDKIPSAEIVPLPNRRPLSVTAGTSDTAAEHVKTTGTPKQIPLEHTYSADEIKTFKNDDAFSGILFVAESYLQRPLTPSDIQTFIFIYDKLQLSVDLIDYLIEYCVSINKTSHHYIQKVAIDWSDAGIKTVQQAKAYKPPYNQTVYSVLKALGNHNAPTEAESSMIQKWTDEYAFSLDILLEACKETVLNTQTNRLKYANAILTNWYKSGVHTLSDIAVADAAHAQKTAARQESRAAGKTAGHNNTFNQFEQRTYDYDALEKQLLSN